MKFWEERRKNHGPPRKRECMEAAKLGLDLRLFLIELYWTLHDASVLLNDLSRPSISSLVFVGSHCVRVPGVSRLQNVIKWGLSNSCLFFSPHDQPNSIWVSLSFSWYLVLSFFFFGSIKIKQTTITSFIISFPRETHFVFYLPSLNIEQRYVSETILFKTWYWPGASS